MASLLPADAVAELEAHLGAKFANLSEPERLALVTPATEGMLSHPRFREICTDHPSDITKMLGRRVLAHVLNRNPDDLLKRTLNPLVDEGRLKTAFLSRSDPRQAYTTVDLHQPISNS